MPFYEYQCRNCDHRLEVLQKISDEPLVYCPVCNEATLKKLISAAAFHLKGTGWYQTDFKNSGNGKDKASSAKSDSSDAVNSKDGSSSESSSSDSSSKTDTAKSDSAAKTETSPAASSAAT